MKKQLATLILAIAAAAPALAAPETFNLDNNHTFPRFSYSHLGYTIQMSRFDKVTGAVVLDKAAKTGKVDIVIDTKSVNTGSEAFNEHIQGEDFRSLRQCSPLPSPGSLRSSCTPPRCCSSASWARCCCSPRGCRTVAPVAAHRMQNSAGMPPLRPEPRLSSRARLPQNGPDGLRPIQTPRSWVAWHEAR